ncbi:MAG TPA: VOC family protein [Asanoa sp.]|jgi:catechol 2,3-dioxygenase-like lactoylglutathione lyase family enzyme|nr:VOC family protein [Asanoa sp.]
MSSNQKVGSVDMRLEVITLPVSDVDRAKAFYQGLGWRLDIDAQLSDEVRAVQLTPPHSAASIQFGTGATDLEPGRIPRIELTVGDLDAARDDLLSRGVQVSDLFHRDGAGFQPGRDPENRSYFTYASFADPDGNEFLLQEITQRLPGRTWD